MRREELASLGNVRAQLRAPGLKPSQISHHYGIEGFKEDPYYAQGRYIVSRRYKKIAVSEISHCP